MPDYCKTVRIFAYSRLVREKNKKPTVCSVLLWRTLTFHCYLSTMIYNSHMFNLINMIYLPQLKISYMLYLLAVPKSLHGCIGSFPRLKVGW